MHNYLISCHKYTFLWNYKKDRSILFWPKSILSGVLIYDAYTIKFESTTVMKGWQRNPSPHSTGIKLLLIIKTINISEDCGWFILIYAPSVTLEWAATASSARAASTGAQEMHKGSSTWQRTLITDVWGAQKSMLVRLGHSQSQTSNVCRGMTGQWSDRSAMSSRKTLSPPGPMSYLCSLTLRIWTSFWRREGSAGMDVEHSNGAVKTAFDIQADGKHGPGRPKMTWKQLTERGCREWKLSAIDPHDSHTWRSGVRSAMHAASQQLGRGPTDVDVAPVPAH